MRLSPVLLAVFLSGTLSAQTTLDLGLIAHWPIIGNAEDISGNDNDAFPIGAVLTTDRDGAADQAYSFNGSSDYLNVPVYVNMSPIDAVAIAAWVRVDANGRSYIYDRLENNDGFSLGISSSGELRMTINGGLGQLVSPSSIVDGNWHHVVGQFSFTSGMELYIDAELVATDPFTSSITYIPEPRNGIGGPGAGSNFFEGDIDELRVYERKLDLWKIATLAEVDLDLATDLVSYYPFTGNPGDSAGIAANDGTVSGATLTTDRHGNPASAYSFDGVDDVISISDNTEMSPTDAVTVAAWIRTSSNGQDFIFDRIETNDGFGLGISTAGHLRMTINGGIAEVLSPDLVTDGEWHHVAGTYSLSEGGIRIFIDGIGVGTTPYSDPITYSPEPRIQ